MFLLNYKKRKTENARKKPNMDFRKLIYKEKNLCFSCRCWRIKVLGHLHITPTGTLMTSCSISIGNDMALLHPLQEEQLPLFLKAYYKLLVFFWIFAHSCRWAIVRSGNDFEQKNLAHISKFRNYISASQLPHVLLSSCVGHLLSEDH